MKNKSLDQIAHEAAKLVNCRIVKCKEKRSPDNKGGYRLVFGKRGEIAAGERFDLSAEDVIEVCRALWIGHWASCRSDCSGCTEGLTKAEILERRVNEIFLGFI